jgi:hypothetical protein
MLTSNRREVDVCKLLLSLHLLLIPNYTSMNHYIVVHHHKYGTTPYLIKSPDIINPERISESLVDHLVEAIEIEFDSQIDSLSVIPYERNGKIKIVRL